MSRPGRLKDKDRKSNLLSVDNYDEDSAARTRPFSFEEIMLRRKNNELLENVKDPAKEAWNISPEGSLEKITDNFESPSKHHKVPSFSMEKHASEELVNVSSRKKIKSTIVKEDDLTEGRDRANNVLETKSSAGLNNKGWITEEKNGKERRGSRKIEQMSKNSDNKHSRDSVNKDSYEEKDRSKSAGKIKKTNHIEDEENRKEYYTERKHGKDRHDGGKIKKWLSNDFEEVSEKKHHRDSDKHIHAEDRAKYEREINKETRAKHEREIKRKNRNGDDEIQDRNATRKQEIAKHHNPHIYERKNRQEKVKSHYEEPTMKRRRSRSREREDRRRSPSFSPRAHRNTCKDGERKDFSMLSLADSSRKKHSGDKNRVSTNGSSRRSRSREREDRRRSPSFSPRAHRKAYQGGECKDLSMLSLTDSSRKKHSDDKNKVSTNGSSSHHRGYRHSSSASGLGGYSPRKRKSETDNKTPSPSKHSPEKKRAGWDLPPVGTDPSPAVVSSGFQLSNNSVLSSMHDVASGTSLDLSIVKPLPVSFLNAVSAGKNVSIDSVQLTQATRPMRRLYIENLPASVSEKVVMDCFNNLLLSAGVNLIQQTRPCISCIVHKDRGQALVEFLTAEDASAALSFDGSTLFGSTVKIRRPKDYVEFATGEPERSVEVAVTISDVVVNSPNKIFIGGISNHVSSDMLMEIAGVFGSLKAYHFEAKVSNGSCAFVEYVDHSVTIKACAGLNGMKLGGEVLTVVLAMPDAPPMENDGNPPSYDIPEHAKPLLSEPTEVLEIKNVFAVESISSLSDMGIEDILEDVRLECARFGTVKSIHLARHSEDKNVATKSEVKKKVVSEEASLDTHTVTNNNAESSSSEEATCSNSMGTSGMELHCDKDLEDKDNNDTSVNVDKNAEILDNTAFQEQEHLVTDASRSTCQRSPDHQDTPNDAPELHDNMVDNDIDKRLGDNMDSKNTVCPFQEGINGCDRSSELVGPRKGIDDDDEKEDHTYNHVFEPGSILVEYARTEACRSAAHCLHRRFFDGRMVTVQYIPLSLYRARFTK
ncbi:unnamed protein product [Trifolium pratense]|uniref:Uncharacterized protein n=1 Tax=Trifolium pratense TaxID=57577 RepID=A0ACB0LX35_TRIPR|nr:unnamed protein product [Trifolium pratense]